MHHPLRNLLCATGFCVLAVSVCTGPAKGQNTTIIDRNANGLSDLWEMAYPGGMLVAEEDFDGDGFSNTQEDRAGTDPRDPSSFPHISELNLNVSTPLTVEWIAVAGKRYQLDYSLDLINWQTLAGSIVGDGGTHELSLDQNKILTGSGVPLLRWDNYLTSNFNNLKAYVSAGTPVSVNRVSSRAWK